MTLAPNIRLALFLFATTSLAACGGCASSHHAKDGGTRDAKAHRDRGVDGGLRHDANTRRDGACDARDARGEHHDASVDRGRRDRGVDRPLLPDYGPLPDIDVSKCLPAPDAGAPASKPSLKNVTFGKIVWKTKLSAPKLVSSIAADQGRIFIAGSYYGHLALDAKGHILWKQIPPIGTYDRIYTSTHLTAHGVISLATVQAALEIRSQKDGAVLWKRTLPGPFTPAWIPNKLSMPIVSLPDGSFVVGGHRRRLTRVAASGTKFLFDETIPGTTYDDALVADGTRIYVALHGSGRIAAYAHDGAPVWQRSAGTQAVFLSLTLGPQKSLITFGTPQTSPLTTTVSSFDRACGRVRWQKIVPGAPIITASVAVGLGGEIAITAAKHNMFFRILTYNPMGKLLWKHEFGPVWSTSRFSYTDGGTLRVFGPVGADNVLHVLRCQSKTAGVWKNRLVTFDMKTGQKLDDAELPFTGCASRQAVLLDNGLLVVTAGNINNDVYAYAIQTKSPGLAKTAWPTFCVNNARTCNDSISLAP